MDAIDESGYSADSSNVSEEGSLHQTELVVAGAADIITDRLHSKKPSAEIQLGAGQGSILDKSKISFSSGSRSSTDSDDTVIDPRISHVRGSEPCLNDQPAQSSEIKKDQPYRVASSSEVTDITHVTTLMSPRQCPPLQVMDRSAPYEPGRISSSVFTANSTPQEWSLASNESLFSLHVGHIGVRNGVLETGDQYRRSSDFALSDEVVSNRPSIVAGQEAARSTVETAGEQAKASLSDKASHDILLQKIHDLADAKARIPETSWDPRKNIGKIQPLPTTVNMKPEKPSSCCKMWSCCRCSCASMSCCCPTSGSCCSKSKCSCCKMPSCSLSWCCIWSCCSKKSCCSSWSWSCPKGSCCMSCSKCSKALCCWNWSCWKLLCCWNWSCCSPGKCCQCRSFCSKGSCGKPWSCCSKGSFCKPWSCCSKVSCCKPWSCCSKGACCGSSNCCSKGTCCPTWNCCSNETSCGSWKCCSIGSCCKSCNCFPTGSCCKTWNCCSISSCCPNWNCCSKGLCSWKCGSCCKSWNGCPTGLSCSKSFKISMCCLRPSSNKPRDRGVGLEMAHHHHKTKTLGGTGICGWLSCYGCSYCRRRH